MYHKASDQKLLNTKFQKEKILCIINKTKNIFDLCERKSA